MTQVFEWDSADPLARASPETLKANQALNDYEAMGTDRSLVKLCNQYKEQRRRYEQEQAIFSGHEQGKGGVRAPPTVILSTLEKWSSTYHWQARLAQYQRMEYERNREQWRERRRKLLQGLFGKTAGALEKFNPQDAYFEAPSLSQLTTAVKVLLDELRAEYDDLPTQRTEITGAGGGPIETKDVTDLTDEERLGRLMALYERVRERRDRASDEDESIQETADEE